MNIVKKLISQFVFILITLGGALLIWEYWQKENKSLTVNVDSNVAIASLGSNKIDGLELLYKARPIDSLTIIELTFLNNGNAPIRPDDIIDNIRIHFAGDIVIKPTIIKVSPKQLNPEFSITNNNSVSLEKLLLNPDDYFTVKFYVTNFSGYFSEDLVEGRISGVKRINIVDKVNKKELSAWSIASLVSLGAALITLLSTVSEKFSKYIALIISLMIASNKHLKKSSNDSNSS
ncbi:hypothetical protein [Solidesulfovibrio sp.]|uniref:hypothetical protein n=1 Tax=Solidesulfovibrio sp. TaxID=2910990 RepID=UPI002601D7CC|nr:hypothetical protein [Solidesulfovibrio sp.]